MTGMTIDQAVASADGLAPDEAAQVAEMLRTWRRKKPRNDLRERYYLQKVTPRSLGIAVPPKYKIQACCGWPRRAVDYIASRSQFLGYTTSDDEAAGLLRDVVAQNDMRNAYARAVTSELMHCFAMLSVTEGDAAAGEPDVLVSMTPATAASGIWDERSRQLRCGLAVVDAETRDGVMRPTWVDAYLDGTVLSIRRDGSGAWAVTERSEYSLGRALMEPMANEPTLMRPFGRSLISRSVMMLSDAYMREMVRSEVAAEFSASPQKYLLGAARSQIGGATKYDAYIGSIFAVSKDRDGDVPQYGQLPQLSMQPHIDYNRSLACQFSGETNVPLSALGVVSDNPNSAESIYASKEDAVIQVQRINSVNGECLRKVGWMALALKRGTDYETERRRVPDLAARFRNPAMPSIVSQSDAVVKQVSVMGWMAQSDVVLEELGYDEEQIQRLRSSRESAQAMGALAALSQVADGQGAGYGS